MTRVLLQWVGLLTIWLGWQGACFALLGEDEKQIEQRYGKAIPEIVDHLGPLVMRGYFVRNTYAALVVFDHGKSISEAYFRADKQRFAEHSISACLKGNGHSKKWRPVTADKGVDRAWVLSKNEAYAAYSTEGQRPLLLVFAHAFIPFFQTHHDFASARSGKFTRQ